MKIWIIDDDEIFRTITSINLQKLDFDINYELFVNGRDPVDAMHKLVVEKTPFPDVILLDINMPVADGWSFLNGYNHFPETIRSGIDLYICSSSIDPKDRERAIGNQNVIAFKEKPLSALLLKEIIQKVLNKKNAVVK